MKPQGGFSLEDCHHIQFNEEFDGALLFQLTQALSDIPEPDRCFVVVGGGHLLFTLMKIWKRTKFIAIVVNKCMVKSKSNSIKDKWKNVRIDLKFVEDDHGFKYHDKATQSK
jgi:hypothetical protein